MSVAAASQQQEAGADYWHIHVRSSPSLRADSSVGLQLSLQDSNGSCDLLVVSNVNLSLDWLLQVVLHKCQSTAILLKSCNLSPLDSAGAAHHDAKFGRQSLSLACVSDPLYNSEPED